MTVRHLIRRAWLAAFLTGVGAAGVSAQSSDPLPLPPLPGATPVAPPAAEGLPPLTPPATAPAVAPPPLIPATNTTPSVPPPAAPAVPPLAIETPKAAPVVPPPMTVVSPVTVEVKPPVAATIAPKVPAMPPAVVPMMSPMPTAAPELPPMVIPSEAKAVSTQVTAVPPTNPMAPPAAPTFETPAAKAAVATKAVTEVKMGKPAIDGLAAYSMMLTEAKLAYGKVADYSGHVIHQDRVRGKLTPDQTAEIRVKTKPASVSLRYVAPNAMMGLELVHVAGRNVGKLRLKPAGSFGPGGFLSVELTDSRATAHTRHLATEVGIGPMIEMLEKNLVIEQRLRNAVQVGVAEYTYAGRPVTRFEVYTDRAHALRYAYRTVVFVDKETKLPIRIEAYDQPTVSSPATGDLLESYSYVNLKFNQGLGDATFEK
jgi:hypothetical protein